MMNLYFRMSDTSLPSGPLPDEKNEEVQGELLEQTNEKSQQSTNRSENSLVREIKAVQTQIAAQETLDLIEQSGVAESDSAEVPSLEKSSENNETSKEKSPCKSNLFSK